MIDRKALWISILVTLAMTGGLIWRLSLLPDWHRMPLDGPDSGHTVNGLLLFSQPLSIAVMTTFLFARKYFATGAVDAVRPWRRWGTLFVIAFCLADGLFLAIILARSLGHGLAVDRQVIGRAFMGVMGVMLMVAGNAVPKLPWLSVRFRWLQLDPWQENRNLRFSGKLIVAMGLLFVCVSAFQPLLPPHVLRPLMWGVGPAVMAASLLYRAKLKREPSPTS